MLLFVTLLFLILEKWNTIFPPSLDNDLDFERQNSIECSHCLPECSFTKYSVLNEYTPLTNTNNSIL